MTRTGARRWTVGWELMLALGAARLVLGALDLYRILSYEDFGLLPAHGAMLSQRYGLAGLGYLIKGGLGGVLTEASAADTAYVAAGLALTVAFLLVVAVPLRRGRRWAWAACWVVVAADVADAATLGPYDTERLVTASLLAGVLAVLLIVLAPALPRRVDRAE